MIGEAYLFIHVQDHVKIVNSNVLLYNIKLMQFHNNKLTNWKKIKKQEKIIWKNLYKSKELETIQEIKI